jgi:hypothetical protein
MSITETSIANRALLEIGADRINSLNEDNKRARACKALYDIVRDEVLRAHPWNFAITRVQLAPLDETPVFQYTYVYQVPTDSLRILSAEDSTVEFKVEGRKIYTDQANFYIRYIKQVTDTSQFDANFAEVVALKLASRISYIVTQSTAVKDECERAYLQALKDARSFDAQEGTPEDFNADAWINARY